MSRWRFLLPLLVAMSAIALLPVTPAGAAEAPTVRTVSVTARGAVTVPNDSAHLSFSVAKERSSRAAALRAVSSKLRSVIVAVKQIPGVEAGDVTTGRISVRKRLRGFKAVYRAAEGIGVTLHKAENAGELVSKAVGAGATGVSGPTYFIGDTEAAAAKALGAAFDKAKAKAEVLAARAGSTLGAALEIDEGEAPVYREVEGAGSFNGSTFEESSSPTPSAPPPTKPGTQKVTATVHVVFELL